MNKLFTYIVYFFSRKYMCRQRCVNPGKTATFVSVTTSPTRPGAEYYFYRCIKCGRGYHTEGPQ